MYKDNGRKVPKYMIEAWKDQERYGPSPEDIKLGYQFCQATNHPDLEIYKELLKVYSGAQPKSK